MYHQNMAKRPNASTRKRTTEALDVLAAEKLQEVLNRFRIAQWDVVLVGDGSGNTWNAPCGWSAVLLDRQTRGRRVFFGAANTGSINFAELMPYLQALAWYDNNYGSDRIRKVGILQVHVITDSQVIATEGNRVFAGERLPRSRALVWGSMTALRTCGYAIQFHWAPRATLGLNWMADCLAGLSRRTLIAATKPPSLIELDTVIESVSNQPSLSHELRQRLDPYAINSDE